MAELILDTATPFSKGSLIEAVSSNSLTMYTGAKFKRNKYGLGVTGQAIYGNVPINKIQNKTYHFAARCEGNNSAANIVTFFSLNYNNERRLEVTMNGAGANLLAVYLLESDNIFKPRGAFNFNPNYRYYNFYSFTLTLSEIKFYINAVLYTTIPIPLKPDIEYNLVCLNRVYIILRNDTAEYNKGLRIFDGIQTDSEIANEYQYFQSITSPIKPIRKFIWDEINKRKIQTHLIETFENNAVGDLYGDPYLTNTRPTISELKTAQYGYEVGKKYLPSSVATNKYAYVKDSTKNKKKVYISIPSNTSTLTTGIVCNIRNGATNIAINGYYLEFNCVTRTIAIKKQGGTQLAISANNVFSFNSLMKLEADFSDPTGIIVIRLNDIVIATSNADLTYTTCESILLNTKYMNVYEIESINI